MLKTRWSIQTELRLISRDDKSILIRASVDPDTSVNCNKGKLSMDLLSVVLCL